jgi:hypothetical protein
VEDVSTELIFFRARIVESLRYARISPVVADDAARTQAGGQE